MANICSKFLHVCCFPSKKNRLKPYVLLQNSRRVPPPMTWCNSSARPAHCDVIVSCCGRVAAVATAVTTRAATSGTMPWKRRYVGPQLGVKYCQSQSLFMVHWFIESDQQSCCVILGKLMKIAMSWSVKTSQNCFFARLLGRWTDIWHPQKQTLEPSGCAVQQASVTPYPMAFWYLKDCIQVLKYGQTWLYLKNCPNMCNKWMQLDHFVIFSKIGIWLDACHHIRDFLPIRLYKIPAFTTASEQIGHDRPDMVTFDRPQEWWVANIREHRGKTNNPRIGMQGENWFQTCFFGVPCWFQGCTV